MPGGSGGSRNLVITPAPNQAGATDITVTVSDGKASTSQTFTLTVTAVDDAPVNSFGGTGTPAPQTVNQNASLVFAAGSGNLIAVADLDAGSGPVTVTLSPTNGTLTLNGTNGLTVVNNADGPGSVAITGPLGSINNALNGLRFTPTPGYTGSATLKVTTDDLGNTGAGGPKTDIDTIPIAVAPFHAAPTISEIPDQSTGQDRLHPNGPVHGRLRRNSAGRAGGDGHVLEHGAGPRRHIQITGSGRLGRSR